MVYLSGKDIDWRESGVDGVQMKTLFADQDAKRVSLLLKIAPGTVYPDHDHIGAEECLMLEGDLHLGGKHLQTFDYMRIPDGGQHGVPWTENGCVCLVICKIAEAA
jgi:anti-sigma factor ChrR (cupin superfamily)